MLRITFELPHFQVNGDVKYTKSASIKGFTYFVFDHLSSCSEYTFQIDLIWIPKDFMSSEKILLATAEGGPFQTKPSANSSTLNLSTISIDSDSIQFQLTGNVPNRL